MRTKKALKRLTASLYLYKLKLLVFSVVFLAFFGVTYVSEVFYGAKGGYVYCGEAIDVVYTWVNGSDPVFRKALNDYLDGGDRSENDFSEARYDDKYELKFSLRSLEKYAPWVRHVYVVTNGQIPYWLNLDYERVTLVSHEEIFEDSGDLPTFSSPAIESHIHRIPGLSRRFIYLNDDMFLNAPVYPEDFYSPNLGFLIYLAWPLPNCADDCPWSYVGDEQCDRSCFNPECQFDGGDCSETTPKKRPNPKPDEYDESDEIVKDDDDYYDLKTATTAPIVNVTKFESRIRKRNDTELSVVKPLNISEMVDQHNRKVLEENQRRRRKNRSVRHRNGTYNGYKIASGPIRKTNSDSFALSLQHTNRIFNSAYRFVARKVPAHAPIMIDTEIIAELQKKFRYDFRKTSSNKLRSPDDLQYSFAYYYYVIGKSVNRTVAEIFDEFDTDESGTWSDREIRTILTKLNHLPLTYNMVDLFDQIIINCSKNVQVADITVPPYERYIDSKLPTITKEMIVRCLHMVEILEDRFGSVPKYKYEIIKNAQSKYVMFKMLTSNITNVVSHLDEIRRSPRKFVCLNDDIDPKKLQENEIVRDILLDFYISLFPKPSRFELPEAYRNRFAYVAELNDWRSFHAKTKALIFICIICISFFMFNSLKRRLPRRIKKYIYL